MLRGLSEFGSRDSSVGSVGSAPRDPTPPPPAPRRADPDTMPLSEACLMIQRVYQVWFAAAVLRMWGLRVLPRRPGVCFAVHVIMWGLAATLSHMLRSSWPVCARAGLLVCGRGCVAQASRRRRVSRVCVRLAGPHVRPHNSLLGTAGIEQRMQGVRRRGALVCVFAVTCSRRLQPGARVASRVC